MCAGDACPPACLPCTSECSRDRVLALSGGCTQQNLDGGEHCRDLSGMGVSLGSPRSGFGIACSLAGRVRVKNSGAMQVCFQIPDSDPEVQLHIFHVSMLQCLHVSRKASGGVILL